jgi:Pentapeptide repeats (9 copies)
MCDGERLGRDRCLAHLDVSELDAVGERLQSGQELNARGVRITSQRLNELFARLRPTGGPARVPLAHFNNAQFVGMAHFKGVEFLGDAHFDDACFSGIANFHQTRFSGEADFRDTTFSELGLFKEARFSGQARYDGAQFFRDADFNRAQFSVAQHLGPLSVGRCLILREAVFNEHVRVEARADRLLAEDAVFRSGTDVLVQSAKIEFDRAAFEGTSTIGPATRHNAPHPLMTAESGAKTIPSLLSLRAARIGELAVSGVDLRSCRFHGAQGLANLRLEQVLLAEPPEGRTKARHLPFPLWWTRRMAIAEEHQWRAENFGWPRPDWPSPPPEPTTPPPHQLAAIYRALRSGREERKDEPGAADFYYGEMEMRRQSRYKDDPALSSKPPYAAPALESWASYDNTRRTPVAERFVLWLYWLVSGYGLRASRSLAALAITIAVGAGLLSLFGFDEGQRPESGALMFAIESSIGLLRAPETDILTDGGNIVQIVLRLAGPLFFALALLSLRGRVKR